MKTETMDTINDAVPSARKTTLREQILNAQDMREELVDVSRWGWAQSTGGKLLAKSLTGLERATLSQMSQFNIEGVMVSEQTAVDTAILGTYDPANPTEKVFRETDREALLEGHNSAPFERLATVINKLSGISLRSEEEIEKNSKAIKKST